MIVRAIICWPRYLKGRFCLVLVLSALLASTALNLFLYRALLQFYREVTRVRLDPTESGLFAAGNIALSPPKPGCLRVVLLGDSRVAQWKQTPATPRLQIINRGIAGQTTAQILLRLDEDVLRLKPDIVVVEAGINDLKSIGVLPAQQDQIVESCAANLGTIVQRARDQGIHVVLLTVFPAGPVEVFRRPVWSPAIPDAITKTNAQIMQLSGPSVTVVDCDPTLKLGAGLNPAFAADCLHLRAEAYAALNSLLLPILEELVWTATPPKQNHAVQHE